MKLSCGNGSFPLLDLDTSVEVVARLGFGGFDLMLAGNRPSMPVDEITRDVAGWSKTFKQRLSTRGLVCSDVFCIPWSDYETMSPNNPARAEQERGRLLFRNMLDLCEELDAPGVTMLPGTDWPNESHEDSLKRAAAELGLRAEEALARGLRLSVEPHIDSVCRSPADAARLCELAPGLQLTLDYTHYVAKGFGESEIEPLLPYTGHLHMRGGCDGRVQTPVKENTIDYDRIIDLLNDLHYEGYLAVEYSWVDWEGMNQADVISETILMRDWLATKLAGEQWSYPAVPAIN
jgi:sugar phosphate isomerase/epimerase